MHILITGNHWPLVLGLAGSSDLLLFLYNQYLLVRLGRVWEGAGGCNLALPRFLTCIASLVTNPTLTNLSRVSAPFLQAPAAAPGAWASTEPGGGGEAAGAAEAGEPRDGAAGRRARHRRPAPPRRQETVRGARSGRVALALAAAGGGGGLRDVRPGEEAGAAWAARACARQPQPRAARAQIQVGRGGLLGAAQ